MFTQKLRQVEDHQRSSRPLPLGPAPQVSSKDYKLPETIRKPLAHDWDHLWSLECQQRGASTLKALAASGTATANESKDQSPEILFGTGRPTAELYPIRSMHVSHIDTLQADAEKCAASTNETKREHEFDLSIALNYGFSAGSAQLLRFVTEHVQLIHDPPYQDWECCLTSGATAAFETAFRMFCNRGDTLLVEEYSYAGALESARPLGIDILGIRMDAEGLMPDDLEDKLCKWPPNKGTRPSVLYTIPSGQNPTAATQSAERRRAIYAVAERYDLYIIEDDPYYFLQLQGYGPEVKILSPDEYVKSLPPSYLSMDISGRVLRLESTAKILAPGLRCAWLTASAPVVAKFRTYHEATMVAPSGLAQYALYTMLDVDWGHEGFMKWLSSLSAEYSRRNNALLTACKRHLPRDICFWEAPKAGMFLWIHVRPGVSLSAEMLSFIEEEIFQRAKQSGVVISKGSWFAANAGVIEGIHLRLTFAAASTDVFDLGIMKLAEAIRHALPTTELPLGVTTETGLAEKIFADEIAIIERGGKAGQIETFG